MKVQLHIVMNRSVLRKHIQNMQKKTLLEHKLWYNSLQNTIAMIGSGFYAGRHKEVCGS